MPEESFLIRVRATTCFRARRNYDIVWILNTLKQVRLQLVCVCVCVHLFRQAMSALTATRNPVTVLELLREWFSKDSQSPAQG